MTQWKHRPVLAMAGLTALDVGCQAIGIAWIMSQKAMDASTRVSASDASLNT